MDSALHPLSWGNHTPKANGQRSFLTHLAVYEHVSAATQRQALNAIVFLYHTETYLHVMDKSLSGVQSSLDQTAREN